MKKLLGISAAMAFAMALAFSSLPASAQEEGDFQDDFVELDVDNEFTLLEEEISADEIESASKHRQSIFWSPSAVTVFTREQIHSSGANTLYDLLRQVPGLDVYEAKPSYPIVGARALTDDSNNLVLVLIDGREALIELVGFALWAAMDIDLIEIERVEVIRGPGSTLYGANAFAAVVNITTVSENPSNGSDIYLSGGEDGHRRLFARARGGVETGNGTLSFSAGAGTAGRRSASDRQNDIKRLDLRSHGYLRYRRGRRLSLSLHGGVVSGDGTMYMHVGDMFSRNVLNHFEMGKADVMLGNRVRLKAQVYHNRTRADFRYRIKLQAYDTWVADVPNFYMETNTVDGQVQLDVRAGSGLFLIGGANLRYTNMDSDNAIPKNIVEVRGAGFAHAQWQLFGVLQLCGGLRLDFNTKTQEALSPRAVVVYRPLDNHSFRLGYGLAFRKPAFIESSVHFKVLNYNPAFPELVDKLKESLGNEELVNEKVHSFEAGWRAYLLGDRLELAADLFANIYQDNIYFHVYMPTRLGGVPDILNSVLQFRNQASDILAFGGELSASWAQSDRLTLWVNLGLRMVVDADSKERLPAEPVLRVNLGCRWSPEEGWTLDLALHYTSPRQTVLLDPREPLGEYPVHHLGQALLLVGRAGHRWILGERQLEAGLTVRSPLGLPFREFAGVSFPDSLQSKIDSDFGGEKIVRWVSLYLRGSF